MTAIRNHSLLANLRKPFLRTQGGSGSSGSTYTLAVAQPLYGSLCLIAVGGAQGRAVISVTGSGGSASTGWQNLNQGNQLMTHVWKIADGTEVGPFVVTMIGAQTGVCIWHEFVGIQGTNAFAMWPEETIAGYVGTSGTSLTFNHNFSSLIFTAISTNGSDGAWTIVNNGFGNLLNSNYVRTAYKYAIGKGSGTVTWSGSAVSRTGNVLTLVFKWLHKTSY